MTVFFLIIISVICIFLLKYNITHYVAGQVTGITDKAVTPLSYEYTTKGQLWKETLSNGNTVEYTYDVLGNLKTKQGKDPNGAVISTVDYQYNSASQLTQVGSSSYTYDKNGNVTSDGTRSYKWDAGGRLVEVDDANGTAIAAYSYDSLNRMVQKTVNGSTTNYLYDGMSSHVVAEYDGSGKQLNYYTWGPSGLLSITTGGKAYYAVHGRRGDIEALTDATGNVVVTYKYDTWGNLLSYTDDSGVGLAMSNPYRYADYRYDSDVGMYYLMARWYDSNIGRFLSPDPEFAFFSYDYADNDPVSFIDPTGYMAAKYEEVRSSEGLNNAGSKSSTKTKNTSSNKEISDADLAELDVISGATHIGSIEIIPGGSIIAGAITDIVNSRSLPKKEVVKQNGVTIEHYYPDDHGNPTHLHVKGGGPNTKIGPQGLPTKGQPKLSSKQAKVVEDNIDLIKKTVKQIQKWLK